MASSSTGPHYARRFIILAIVIVLAIAAYSAGWYWLAREVDRRVAQSIATLESQGIEVVCEDRSIRGYPFRLGLHCSETAIANPAENVSFSAGALRSAAQVYDPLFLVGELDGPAHLETEELPPLALGWEVLRASVRLASPLPERVSLESRGVTVAAADQAGQPAGTLRHVEAHMRPNGADLDLALRFEGLELDPSLTGGRTAPALSGEADIAVAEGVQLLVSEPRSLRGRSGMIRNARLTAGGGSISLSGPFSVDDEGLVDAELQIALEEPQALAAVLSGTLPEMADQIEAAFTALAAMGETPSLPLTISNGRVSLAFLDLGQIPPL